MRIRFWRQPAVSDERRQALERWVRLRFRMLDADPMPAIAGAIARLTGEGIERKVAVDMVMTIFRDEGQVLSQ
jgi:hypothetical protein